MMSSYGRRLRWRSCPGPFSLWSTAAARTGNSGCSSTWNTRMLVLLEIAPRDGQSQLPRVLPLLLLISSACLVSAPAGNRAAGRLHTCCSVRGLQWTVNPFFFLSLDVSYELYSCPHFNKKKTSKILWSQGRGGVGGGYLRGITSSQ